MQNSNDDNDWGDLLPSLEETLDLLPELRETAEALGNLRTDPNHNDPKSSGHPGPPTSRAIAPAGTPPYNPLFPNEPPRRHRRSKPDLRASGDNKPPSSPRTLHSNRVSPKKGSYRAAMAKARLFVAEKESQLQFTPANESDSDREFRRPTANSTTLDRHKKLYTLSHSEVGNIAGSNSVQQVQHVERNSKVHSFPFVERSQPAHTTTLIEKKRGYVGRAAYLSTSDSSESSGDTTDPSDNAETSKRRKGNSPRRKTTVRRSASPLTIQQGIHHHTRASPRITSEYTTENSRPRRRAATVAMERARSQIDDPFPGLFAPRRVNRRTAEQKALIHKLTGKEPVVKMGESAAEEDQISQPPITTRKISHETQLFYKMESIDPEE
ncbi:hypothetical protein C7212DRAFT_362450 [Tuber magnatum]|uniref:Uncharacterized protein n=1 Tax=Tuber magnatum TaxID=42249 RepID=A0A317SWS1_9PEZI|nr:hypothetical protein C7212DRAFT_362450 [Tuber magnatum]